MSLRGGMEILHFFFLDFFNHIAYTLSRGDKMTQNFQTFLKLNKTKFANQYIVIIDKKLIANGKDIVSMLKSVRKKYPRKTPFIAKIPDKSLLVL